MLLLEAVLKDTVLNVETLSALAITSRRFSMLKAAVPHPHLEMYSTYIDVEWGIHQQVFALQTSSPSPRYLNLVSQTWFYL